MKLWCFGLLAPLCLAASLFATDAKAPAKPASSGSSDDAAAKPSGPDFGSTWAQNGAYSLANLEGKVVVLYYFTET
jgi:cytochrome oxidase Cu insertion factor (SCO1/SenC/PrrC family)